MIFNRFIKRNHLSDLNIHFHTLRHTFSNILFELNESSKVIQQHLGHRDVKTTITVYNNVNSDYIKESTNRLNDKLNENEAMRKRNNIPAKEQEEQQKEIQDKTSDLSDEELERLLREKQERRRRKQHGFEM